jgi:Lysine methyltransferase
MTSSGASKRLVFPDILNDCHHTPLNTIGDNTDKEDTYNELISNIFFDLANASEILYRIQRRDNTTLDDQYLRFHQDMGACSNHTGGIIWETSYLLLQYLLERHNSDKKSFNILGRTCELGAGVGFLGQCLVAEHCSCIPSMVLTETADVVANLQSNVLQNQPVFDSNTKCKISVAALDWTCYKEDVRRSEGSIQPHSFDTLLGTDVIFTTSLVDPLLQTATYLSHEQTIWYLCVQIRCAAAHELFLQQAPKYGFCVSDISAECFDMSHNCSWGKTLECFLFRITRIPNSL